MRQDFRKANEVARGFPVVAVVVLGQEERAEVGKWSNDAGENPLRISIFRVLGREGRRWGGGGGLSKTHQHRGLFMAAPGIDDRCEIYSALGSILVVSDGHVVWWVAVCLGLM